MTKFNVYRKIKNDVVCIASYDAENILDVVDMIDVGTQRDHEFFNGAMTIFARGEHIDRVWRVIAFSDRVVTHDDF